MNLRLATVTVAAAAIILAPSSRAINNTGDSNPYEGIMDRNIFRLNPVPPPTPVDQKPVELPKVYLSGIIRVGNNVRVLFSIPPKDNKSDPSYHSLAPGEEDEVLKVIGIHPGEKEVDVVVEGTPMTLSMVSNSLAASGASLPMGRRGVQAAPGGTPVAAAGSASAIIVGGGGSSSSSPYGGVSVSGGGGGGVTVIGGNNNNSVGSGGGVSVSGGGFNQAGVGGGGYGGGVSVAGGNSVGNQLASALFSGTPAQSQTAASTSTQPAASPEQQAVGLLTEYQKNPSGPPLPPPLAQMVGVDTSEPGGDTPPTPTTPSTPRTRPPIVVAPPPVP